MKNLTDNCLLMNSIHDIAIKTHLGESAMGVKSLLQFVGDNPNCQLEKASAELNIPVPVLAAVRRESEKAGLLLRSNGLVLSEEGKKLVGIPTQIGKDILFDQFMGDLKDIFLNRPQNNPQLNQAHSTPQTSFERAHLILKSYPRPSTLLTLGDDDLVSLSTQYLAEKFNVGLKVAVLEVDNRLTEYIQQSAIYLKLEINVICHDIHNGIPPDFENSFECFCTDPPYNLEGLKSFLSAGTASLKTEPGCRGYLSYPQLPPVQQLEFHRILQERRLVVREIRKNFNLYHGATIHAHTSSLFTLEYVPNTS